MELITAWVALERDCLSILINPQQMVQSVTHLNAEKCRCKTNRQERVDPDKRANLKVQPKFDKRFPRQSIAQRHLSPVASMSAIDAPLNQDREAKTYNEG